MSRDLIIVAASLAIWGIGEGSFLFFQPLYLQQLGADPLRIGAILGAYGVIMTIAHIPAGYLADRVGRRPVMWTSWFLGVLAAWIMALADSLPVFVIGLLVYGLTLFVMSPLNSYITAARGKLGVGQAIMLVSASFNLGMVLGPLLGGYIGERYGLNRIFLVAGLIFILATVLILFIHPQPVDPQPVRKHRFLFMRDGQVKLFLGLIFLTAFATYLAQPLSQNFLADVHQLSLEQIGQLTAFSGLGVLCLSLLLGRWNERLGFLIGQAAVGGFALLLWKSTALPWFALGYFLLGGYKTTRSLGVAQMRSLVSGASMGLAYGVTESIGSLATILAPVLAGWLYQHDPYSVYSVAVGSILVSIAASLKFAPRTTPEGATQLAQPALAPEDD